VITCFHAIVSTLVTGSFESRHDHTAGKFASTLLRAVEQIMLSAVRLCPVLSELCAVEQIMLSAVRLCPLLSEVLAFMLYGMRMSFDHLVYFLLPNVV
jgi:hypothetical protein